MAGPFQVDERPLVLCALTPGVERTEKEHAGNDAVDNSARQEAKERNTNDCSR